VSDAAALARQAAARQQAGDAVAAAALWRQAIAAGFDTAEARNNLGVACRDLGDARGAASAFRAALRARPGYGRAAANLAALLRAGGDPAAGARVLEAALAAGADAAPAAGADAARAASPGASLRGEAAQLFREAGRPDLALPHARALAKAAPQDPLAVSGLGETLLGMGRPHDALPHLAAVAAALPDRADAKVNHGLALLQSGRAAAAAAVQRAAIAQDPACRPAWHNLLLALNYVPEASAAEVAAAHRAYGAAFPPRPAPPFANPADPGRRLRVGFLSGDLRAHPVGYFLEATLAAHPRGDVTLHAYASQGGGDAATARLRGLFDGWRQVQGLPDAAVAAAIRADAIDILVDLSGHTQGTRLPVLEHRAAPVQASWIGYANSTGSAAVDWILADAATVPPGEEALYVERVHRLPGCYLCFTPPGFAVPRTPPPMLARGHVTFGCCNAPMKLNAAVLRAWARILDQVPRARLLLKARALEDAGTAAAIRQGFAAAGGDPARLDIEGHSPRPAYVARLADIDIMLDPFPFPGGTTTAEALRAGVPVLSLRGRGGMMSRNGETLLAAAGLSDWVAADVDDYVAQAVRRARDPAGLAALRAGMDTRALSDGAAMARGLEAAWRAMWRDWCARQG
jgi:predicted O-linked N-acetylglucosamine transferase (SPINDLY family)